MSVQNERKQIAMERPLEVLLAELKEARLVAPGVQLKDVALFLGYGSERTADQSAAMGMTMREHLAGATRMDVPVAAPFRATRPDLTGLTNAQLCMRAAELHGLLKQMEDCFSGRPDCRRRAQDCANAAAIALEMERRLRDLKEGQI